MEYLFLKRKKSTLRSERQKDLLFKAAERHWDEQFALSIGNSSGVFGCHSFFEEIERAGRYESDLSLQCSEQVFWV